MKDEFFTSGAVTFDGSGDYLSLAASSDFAFGTGDFTVEFSMWSSDKTANGVYNRLFCNDGPTGDGTNNLQFNIDASTGALVIWNGGGNVLVGNTNLCDSEWHHVAVTRSGTTIRIFVDGIQDGAATNSTDWGTQNSGSPRVHIGAQNGTGWYDGILSNYRIVKGTALYTSNFTPPTAALTNVTNTKLLCCQSDSSTTAKEVGPTITANGDPTASSQNISLTSASDTSITWPSSIKWNGGSAPTLNTGSYANDANVITLLTRDEGVTWYGWETISLVGGN